jgi:hypothetical protein
VGDESGITVQSPKTPTSVHSSDTSSKKTHEQDYEGKSHDKWFKKTSQNLKNLFKIKTKKNHEKENNQRLHSTEESAHENIGSQLVPPSAKESLQSKMPTIQELSASSSSSTSPRKSYTQFLHLGFRSFCHFTFKLHFIAL